MENLERKFVVDSQGNAEEKELSKEEKEKLNKTSESFDFNEPHKRKFVVDPEGNAEEKKISNGNQGKFAEARQMQEEIVKKLEDLTGLPVEKKDDKGNT